MLSSKQVFVTSFLDINREPKKIVIHQQRDASGESWYAIAVGY